jgi:hypothetical protein
MTCEEKWQRYQKMRREAESELQLFMHAECTADDVFDRFELAFLWRMAVEGKTMTEPTWDQMVEATDA